MSCLERGVLATALFAVWLAPQRALAGEGRLPVAARRALNRASRGNVSPTSRSPISMRDVRLVRNRGLGKGLQSTKYCSVNDDFGRPVLKAGQAFVYEAKLDSPDGKISLGRTLAFVHEGQTPRNQNAVGLTASDAIAANSRYSGGRPTAQLLAQRVDAEHIVRRGAAPRPRWS